jgi:hypothetical protein
MGLNCRPGQWAWIDVPRTPQHEAFGVTQLYGHVVQVHQVVRHCEHQGPIWEVSPKQHWKTTRACTFDAAPGQRAAAGHPFSTSWIPDIWLRPIDELPPEEIERLQAELTL